MNFAEWLFFEETNDLGLEIRKGRDLLADPVMEMAMYLAYRGSYDEVAKADHKEALASAKAEGKPENEITMIKPWSIDHWRYPPGGGTRAPAWTFLGVFPNEAELEKVRQGLEEVGEDVEQLVGKISMPGVGGVAYRDDKGNAVKMTGLWGWNSRAKMLAVVSMVASANSKGQEIFTGADSRLMDMIEKSKPILARLYKSGKIASPELGLATSPKEMSPFLYSAISNNPKFSGGGHWRGYNDDGSLNFDLGGVGVRKKFLLGNKTFWSNQIQNILNRSGVKEEQLKMLKIAMKTGGFVARIATDQVNKKIKSVIPDSPPLNPETLRWIIDQME